MHLGKVATYFFGPMGLHFGVLVICSSHESIFRNFSPASAL